MTRPTAQEGHRDIPHTADVRIEAWSPTREGCLEQAVAALVDTFAEVDGVAEAGEVELHLGPAPDEDLLVTLLDEVIFRLETEGRLPRSAEAVAVDGGLTIRLTMVDATGVRLIGAVPKAVSLHELCFTAGPTGWSCAVTLDV